MDIELPSNRKFASLFVVIFLIAAAWFLWQGRWGIAVLLSVMASLLAVCAIACQSALTPLNRLWMRFGLLLGKIVTPLVMGIIYLVLFVPTGLVMRVFGRDELRLTMMPRPSHWQPRTAGKLSEESFKNQW